MLPANTRLKLFKTLSSRFQVGAFRPPGIITLPIICSGPDRHRRLRNQKETAALRGRYSGGSCSCGRGPVYGRAPGIRRYPSHQNRLVPNSSVNSAIPCGNWRIRPPPPPLRSAAAAREVGVVMRRKRQAAVARYLSMCRHNSLLPSAHCIGPRRTVSGERTCFKPFSSSTSRSSLTPTSRTMPLPMGGSVWSASRKWWRTTSHAVIMDRESPAYSPQDETMHQSGM